MTKFDKLTTGFINTLHEDLTMTFQEQQETLYYLPLHINENQRQIISELLKVVMMRINHSDFTYYLNNPEEVGGDLYIGLMYDSYDTPLHNVNADWYCEFIPFIDPENSDQLLFEGYFSFNGKHYDLQV